ERRTSPAPERDHVIDEDPDSHVLVEAPERADRTGGAELRTVGRHQRDDRKNKVESRKEIEPLSSGTAAGRGQMLGQKREGRGCIERESERVADVTIRRGFLEDRSNEQPAEEELSRVDGEQDRGACEYEQRDERLRNVRPYPGDRPGRRKA